MATELEIFCDGASRNNPGEAAAGAVLKTPGGERVAEVSEYLGIKTNNEAEYLALILALEKAQALGAERVSVKCDSMLMVKQVLGEWKVKHPNMKPLCARARSLADTFGAFSIAHVRREYNKEADALANRALDKQLG